MGDAAGIAIARIHDDPTATPGARLLVDRLWPRGVSKATARLDDWVRDVAPSDDLRKWFAHDRAKWQAFGSRYRAELDANRDPVAHLLEWCRKGPVTLVYAAKDREHNQAVVLRDYLQNKLAHDAEQDTEQDAVLR